MKKLKRRFESRRISYYLCDNMNLKTTLMELINKFSTDKRFSKLGYTDCKILRDINLLDLIKGIKTIDIQHPSRNITDIDNYSHFLDEVRKNTMVDIFITQADGITEKGEILFKDEIGNRIAGTVFGPQRVIILADNNSIYDSIDDFLNRQKDNVYSIIYGSMEGHKDRLHLIQYK